MRILILTDKIKMGEIKGSNIRLIKLIKYISKKHEDIKFDIYAPLISDNHIIKIQNCNMYLIKSNIYLHTVKIFQNRINILKKIAWKILTFPGTIDYMWAFKALFYIKKEKPNCDIIFIQIPSFLNIIYGVILKMMLKKPLVFDLRDDLSNFDHIIGINIIEKNMLKYADKIICVTQGSLNKIKLKYGKYCDKLVYIPNGFDIEETSNIFPEKKNDKTIIVYAGGLDRTRLQICNKLFLILKEMISDEKSYFDKIKIIFYTSNNKINSYIAKYNLTYLISVKKPIQDRNQYFQILANADILLSMNYNTPYSIPGKLYEYLAVNHNVIHVDNSEICNEVLGLFKESHLVKITNISEIKNIIFNMVNNKPILLSSQLPLYFKETFSREKIAESFLDTINSVKKYRN